MDIKRIINTGDSATGIGGFFSAYGSFGIVDGKDDDILKIEATDSGYRAEYDDFSVNCNITEYENNVYLRSDCFIAKRDLILNSFTSRFMLESGDYEVYTQYSSWQNESVGKWQELANSVEVSNLGIRTTEGATPMMAIKNKGNGKILVFHLMPNAQWKIKISRRPLAQKNDIILIETGINNVGLNMKIKTGEAIVMPKVYVFKATSDIDLDSWKLHTAFLKDYKRKNLPIIYNTWMSKFDNISYDEMVKQADACADLGIEYFLIDAGWFGERKSWDNSIGEWEERPDGRLDGKLTELSKYVRGLGLHFGLWIEPERALKATDAVKKHPEYYIMGNGNDAFLDYSNPEAREYIFNVVCGLIEKYSLEIIKFDFNASLGFDETGSGFYRYLEGQREFIKALRNKYPYLYLVNCASGGNRMEMNQMEFFDSIWYSDNQSFVEGIRIYKDTIKRFLPSAMQKWDVRVFANGFPKYGSETKSSLPINCNNATWDSVINVDNSYTYAFLKGGVMGFSADIAGYPDSEKELLKKLIVEYKVQRDFYGNALVKILYDTANITAFQYFDASMDNIVIHVFCRDVFQSHITVYPFLNSNMKYLYNDRVYNGEELMNDGIVVEIQDNAAKEISLVEIK